jgi:hypothetical protein
MSKRYLNEFYIYIYVHTAFQYRTVVNEFSGDLKWVSI